MSTTIVTITAQSCAGKSTLADQLVATGYFSEIVSTTSRVPRGGEIDGVDYHFVAPEALDDIEMLERITFNGNTYGGSIAEFEKHFATGLIPVIVVEPNGMNQININAEKKGWTVINVFLECRKDVQARRFLERFFKEVRSLGFTIDAEKAHAVEEAAEKLQDEYVNRMVSMQEIETQWPMMFQDMKSAQHIRLPMFNESTERYCVETIGEMCKIGSNREVV